MHFSIRDLLLLPLIGFATLPIVISATLVGLILLPQFTSNGSEIRHWFIDRGFSVDFVTGHVTFFAAQIPTILVLTLLAIILFMFRTRICDQVAVITLASLPFVDALQVGTMSDTFDFGGTDSNLGLQYLTTQLLTGTTLAAIIAVYAFARWRIPNPTPSRTRHTVSTLAFGSILVVSSVVWRHVT